jgi:hypothetical protein
MFAFALFLSVCLELTLSADLLSLWIPPGESQCESGAIFRSSTPAASGVCVGACAVVPSGQYRVGKACNAPDDPPVVADGYVSMRTFNGTSCSALKWTQTVEVLPEECMPMSAIQSIVHPGTRALLLRAVSPLPPNAQGLMVHW